MSLIPRRAGREGPRRSKIALILYYYPPSRVSGARRAHLYGNAIAEEYPDCEVHVYVAKQRGCPSPKSEFPNITFFPLSDGSRKDMFAQGKLSRKLAETLWLVHVLARFLSQRYGRGDVVLTMSKPYTNHLVGLIAKRVRNVDWVADFRELLADHKSIRGNKVAARGAAALETVVMKNAYVITVVTPGMAKHFHGKYRRPVRAMVNGINMARAQRCCVKAMSEHSYWENGVVKLVYTGALQPARAEFLEKILLLLGSDEIRPVLPQIAFEYWGDNPVQAVRACRAAGFERSCDAHGRVGRERVEAAQEMANALLLFPHGEPDSLESKVGLTVKVFEYLESFRPILYYGPVKSDLAEFLSAFPHACIIDPTFSLEKVCAELAAWNERIKQIDYTAILGQLQELTWSRQVQGLVSACDEVDVPSGA